MKQLYILIVLSGIVLVSCVDESLNIDPNRPSTVPTTSLISTAQKHLIDNVRGEQASLRSSGLFVQQISMNTYTSQSRYDMPFSYSADIWSGLYGVLNNLQEIIHLNTDAATKDQVTANGAGEMLRKLQSVASLSRMLTMG